MAQVPLQQWLGPQQGIEQQQELTAEQLAVIDRTQMQWVDQFNQNLTLTVQALQALHTAFDEKFSR
jgi:hypothetical protein